MSVTSFMRIEEIVCYQLPVGLRGGYRRDLKVRAVLVGKEAVEDMIALMRTGCRHVDAPPGIAVEVASYDPNQRDGPLQIVVLIDESKYPRQFSLALYPDVAWKLQFARPPSPSISIFWIQTSTGVWPSSGF